MTIQDTTFRSDSYPNTRFYRVKGPLTLEDIQRINQINTQTILVFDNTKDLDPKLIRMIHNPNVQISIQGGLNFYEKRKYNRRSYIERTIHSPNELAMIIEIFQKIEKNIRYTWTDRQKTMYIYKTLCEALHYLRDDESEYEQGRDVTRSLSGLLYGKLVCSGFALVLKEALDRNGIPCIYQNQMHSHSWNIVRLDGNYYAVDLTWDCYNKSHNQCDFTNFGLNPDFYHNPHHSVEHEEEVEFPLATFQIEDLREDYHTITRERSIEKKEMIAVQDSNNQMFYSPFKKDDNGVFTYIIYLYGESFLIHTDKEPRNLFSMDVFHCFENNGWDPSLPKRTRKGIVTYRREDRSVFFIGKSRTIDDKMKEFYYYEVKVVDNKPIVRRATLLSETDLSIEWEDPTRSIIANDLLSKERLRRKVNYARGYVGYIGHDNILYYDRSFEREELHMIEHV